MLRVLIDQDFDFDISRGVARRVLDWDFVTAQELGLGTLPDPELLRWAAAAGRVLFTHDRRTMPHHVGELLAAGETVAGVIIVPRRLSLQEAIDELEIIVVCSMVEDWENTVRFVPL